jgi:hypothetical protein
MPYAIQDKFNEACVEINSPHYASWRDENETAVHKNTCRELKKQHLNSTSDAMPTRTQTHVMEGEETQAHVMEGEETPVGRT